ncbi:class II glutamine amidotransferase domain-containing protein [Actinoplanes awajinensis]|uniref:Glutamine amidotransferase type-2 domain-containing protein n=1 Tax=Actinoplanes awajinensis subsp. mycoplanecinus TaxID=135947 RepID=A0A101JFI6_9ACTN|nr:hypothetical protein [Actinoplanes awajinensis]KUL25830.1 hypothetical protein ADL15_39680 [Actinoplanes awajinensis subsp. mycoplanecinus]
MCLLTFLPGGVPPQVDALYNGSLVNTDGHGFAIVTTGGLLVRHGMDAAPLIDAFVAARWAHPDGDALFHSRLATGGTVSLDNCHPYAVGADPRTVLAHNGVLPIHPDRADPRSDTRIVAESLIGQWGSLRHRRTRLRLQRWMGPANKMVLLSVDRRFRRTSYLFNEQAGEWSGGIWYSNRGYRDWPDLDDLDGPDDLGIGPLGWPLPRS